MVFMAGGSAGSAAGHSGSSRCSMASKRNSRASVRRPWAKSAVLGALGHPMVQPLHDAPVVAQAHQLQQRQQFVGRDGMRPLRWRATGRHAPAHGQGRRDQARPPSTSAPSTWPSHISRSSRRTGLTKKSGGLCTGAPSCRPPGPCRRRWPTQWPAASRPSPRARRRRSVSQPSMPGMARSRNTASGAGSLAGLQRLQQRQRIVAAGGQLHLKAQRLQPALQQLAVGLFVVHHQHPPARPLVASEHRRQRQLAAPPRHAPRTAAGAR